jgi:NAD(P)H-hydrate repair Nnr-like enzyme with NAD(P)H-hydrate dehydratase domain
VSLAAELNAIVVLKGAGTVIADHAGRVFIDAEGTSALATAGSGDVLAGLMGGLLASGQPSDDLAAALVAAAVFIHGRAGRIAGEALGVVTAADIADCLEPALAELL